MEYIQQKNITWTKKFVIHYIIIYKIERYFVPSLTQPSLLGISLDPPTINPHNDDTIDNFGLPILIQSIQEGGSPIFIHVVGLLRIQFGQSNIALDPILQYYSVFEQNPIHCYFVQQFLNTILTFILIILMIILHLVAVLCLLFYLYFGLYYVFDYFRYLIHIYLLTCWLVYVRYCFVDDVAARCAWIGVNELFKGVSVVDYYNVFLLLQLHGEKEATAIRVEMLLNGHRGRFVVLGVVAQGLWF